MSDIIYPVKWFTSEMPGAPVVSGTGVGSLVALLDACLITGFGSASVTDLTVTNGIATATVAPEDVPPKYAVIKISGSSIEELNGEHRVIQSLSASFTFATDAADGTASGTITYKYPPAPQWDIAFTATNKRVYRSSDPHGNRFFYRVDDSASSGNERRWASLRGYTDMQDIDTGTGPFDAEAGGVWKSVTANSKAVMWAVFADSRVVYVHLRNVVPDDSSYDYMAPFVFGDLNRFSSEDLYFAAVVNDAYSTSTRYFAQTGGNISLADSSKTFRSPGIGAIEGYTNGTARPLCGSGQSGNDTTGGSMGTLYNGKILIGPMMIPPRGMIPGVYHVAHTGLTVGGRTNLTILEGSGTYQGKAFMIMGSASGSNNSINGGALIDIIGPWR